MLVYASAAHVVERPDSVAGAAHIRHSKKAATYEENMLREKALLKRHCELPSFPERKKNYIYAYMSIYKYIYTLQKM